MSAFQQYFVDTIKNRYANFEGRARRSEYWYYTLFNFLIQMAAYALILGGAAAEIGILSMIGGAVYMIVGLGLLVPGLAVAVRRLHDTDKSGWMLLIILIPLIGVIALLVFFCTEGTKGTNKYGADPKNPELSQSSDHLV